MPIEFRSHDLQLRRIYIPVSGSQFVDYGVNQFRFVSDVKSFKRLRQGFSCLICIQSLDQEHKAEYVYIKGIWADCLEGM